MAVWKIKVGDAVQDQAGSRYTVTDLDGPHVVGLRDEQGRRRILTRRVLKLATP